VFYPAISHRSNGHGGSNPTPRACLGLSSASGGIRAEEERVDPVIGVVGVGPEGAFAIAVDDEDAKVERPWRSVGVGEGGDAADGREEWARKLRRGPRAV